MKTSIKITFVAFAIAITAAACDPAKKAPTESTDSLKKDSIAADSAKKDTAVVVDSLKKDSVKT